MLQEQWKTYCYVLSHFTKRFRVMYEDRAALATVVADKDTEMKEALATVVAQKNTEMTETLAAQKNTEMKDALAAKKDNALTDLQCKTQRLECAHIARAFAARLCAPSFCRLTSNSRIFAM